MKIIWKLIIINEIKEKQETCITWEIDLIKEKIYIGS